MTFTFIIAVLLATIVLRLNYRNRALRWFACSFYAGSLNIIAFLLDQQHPNAPHLLINTMFFTADALTALSLGMFGILYSELVSPRAQRWLLTAGLLWIALVWLGTPLADVRRINYAGSNELPMVGFIVGWLLVGATLLVVALLHEKPSPRRSDRILTSLLALPVMLSVALSYILYVFNIDLFQINYILALLVMTLFIAFGVKRGVLGVKIRLETMKSDASMQAVQSSANLLNHSIKNEIGKIDILLHQAKLDLQEEQRTPESVAKAHGVERLIDLASGSIQHIQSMMTKIHHNSQIVEVDCQKGDVVRILTECLDSLERAAGTDIRIDREMASVSEIEVDAVHMREVFNNIVMNAMEAIEGPGVISASIMENDHEVMICIRDSGEGIAAEILPHLFEPFYTTKSAGIHHGLGLFYCRNVILRHHGSLHVSSTPGEGSTFTIHLPK